MSTLLTPLRTVILQHSRCVLGSLLIPVISTAAVLSGAGAIAADYRGSRRAFYILKPLATAQILLLAILLTAESGTVYGYWITAGVLLSIAGDVLLMLPGDRFTSGLASFLMAHLCYITGFARAVGWLPTGWVLLIFLAYGLVLYRVLWPYLGSKRVPVAVYALALSAMGWMATEMWLAFGSTARLLACEGALLFILSDSTLAWNRFVGRFRAAQLVVLGTYYTAQLLLALSIGK